LRRLGLTQNEAKIYLALTEAETAETAKNLSIVSEVAREIVYQTMPRLQQKGLVEKIIDKTTLYRAVPIEHAVANLLKQKSQEQQQLRKQIKQLLHRIKDNRNKQSPRRNMETQFKIVPGKEVIVRRLQEALQNTQFSLDVITSPERFIPAITAFADGYKAALQRSKNTHSHTTAQHRKNSATNHKQSKRKLRL
jgi:sugar-specific transcriptional regulator TrmB